MSRPYNTKSVSVFNLKTYNYLKNKYPWMDLVRPSQEDGPLPDPNTEIEFLANVIKAVQL